MPDRFITIDVAGFDIESDDLVVGSLTIEEGMSRLFRCQVDLVSEDLNIRPERFIGLNATIDIAKLKGESRVFNGYINRLSAGGIIAGREGRNQYRVYRAEIVPWLWFLTQTSNCRVFNRPPEQKEKILAVIEEVLSECPLADFAHRNMEAAHQREMEYCVQYRETDFNFVSRLMEQFGIYYYFVHERGRHKMVLSDSLGGYDQISERQVEFADIVGGRRSDHVMSWDHRFEFVPGKYTQTDYDFKRSSFDLRRTSGQSRAQLNGHEQYELFDYPGEYESADDGRTEADVRIEEVEVRHNFVEGESECRSFQSGHRFKLARHAAGEENGEYVLTSVVHTASQPGPLASDSGDLFYRNSFRCLPASTLFVPPRNTERPIISGMQTALVVGPAGSEIHCDRFGRVRVRFHWEREGEDRDQQKTPDERCTCWMRVASQVAGNRWGFVGIPRVGQEVVVDFLEGDPDRPLIVGSVYNAEQMPHYELPEHAAKTYIKTNSTLGGDGFNEIMFDDAAGSERLFLHAQLDKDEMVNAESRVTVGGSKHKDVGEDELQRVGNNKKVQIGNSIGQKVGMNFLVDVGNDYHYRGKEEFKKLSVSKHLIVQGDNLNHTEANLSHLVDGDLDAVIGSSARVSAGSTHLSTGSLVIDASTISLRSGGSFITIGPGGVDIVGAVVNINSGGAAQSPDTAAATQPSEPLDLPDMEPNQAWTSETGHKSSRD